MPAAFAGTSGSCLGTTGACSDGAVSDCPCPLCGVAAAGSCDPVCDDWGCGCDGCDDEGVVGGCCCCWSDMVKGAAGGNSQSEKGPKKRRVARLGLM